MRDEEDGGRERLLVHLLARSGAEGDGEVPAASGDSTSRRRRRRNRRTVTAERERRASSLLVSRRLGWIGLGWVGLGRIATIGWAASARGRRPRNGNRTPAAGRQSSHARDRRPHEPRARRGSDPGVCTTLTFAYDLGDLHLGVTRRFRQN